MSRKKDSTKTSHGTVKRSGRNTSKWVMEKLRTASQQGDVGAAIVAAYNWTNLQSSPAWSAKKHFNAFAEAFFTPITVDQKSAAYHGANSGHKHILRFYLAIRVISRLHRHHPASETLDVLKGKSFFDWTALLQGFPNELISKDLHQCGDLSLEAKSILLDMKECSLRAIIQSCTKYLASYCPKMETCIWQLPTLQWLMQTGQLYKHNCNVKIRSQEYLKKRRPALCVDNDLDTSFRPEELEEQLRLEIEYDNEHLDWNDKRCSDNTTEKLVDREGLDPSHRDTQWEIDLDAFTESELAAFLCGLGGHEDVSNLEESRRSGFTEEQVYAPLVDRDTDEWVLEYDNEGEEDSWESVSSAASVVSLATDASSVSRTTAPDKTWASTDSVMSLSSSTVIFSYKDALVFGSSEPEDCRRNPKPATDMREKIQRFDHVPDRNLEDTEEVFEEWIQRLQGRKPSERWLDEEENDLPGLEADLIRDGVKLSRGGRCSVQFKGNQRSSKTGKNSSRGMARKTKYGKNRF